MNATTRINLHCHSSCSDGALPPEELARRLADAGVVFAALTDHETLDGLARFAAALQRRGIGTVNGVEIPAMWRGEEIHLLIYGFDATHPDLLGALDALRHRREATTQSVAGALRRSGTIAAPAAASGGFSAPLSAAEAIAVAHRAGGRAFLAHPLLLRPNPSDLKAILTDLQADGLDGIEALYAPSAATACEALIALAAERGLLVCAGTDLHTPEDGRVHGWGVDVPNALWRTLRDALHLKAATTLTRPTAAYFRAGHLTRSFGLHILLPAILAVVLFIVMMWAVFIPSFERALLDRKREMIGELVHATWSMMDAAERQVLLGRLTREEAQAETREQIAALRYGHQNKDYFWLQDKHPRMVMHPYRPDLNGQDLSDYRDPRGKRIFVEFADVVRRRREGLVAYVWQWPDDPRRLESKESYVKGFEPWGWIVGTGIYLEDIKQEIARIERSLILESIGITTLLALLLAYVVGNSRRLDRERVEAVEDLQATTERYRSLVEVATEGTLLVLAGRCRYANPHLLTLMGYTASELELLDLTEVVPPAGANTEVWGLLEAFERSADSTPRTASGEIRRRDGTRTACAFVITRIAFGSRGGIVLLVRERVSSTAATSPTAAGQAPAQSGVEISVDQAPIGLFRARADRPATIVATNAIAARCLRAAAGVAADESAVRLADAFRDPDAFVAFMTRLRADGMADGRLSAAPAYGASTTFALRTTLLRDDAGEPLVITGLVEDITSRVAHEHERDAMIERLQASLLFLHEPVSRVLKPGVFCTGDMPARKVAALLAEHGDSATLVRDASGEVIGIVTAGDLCTRVLAAGQNGHTAIRTVMSAPVTAVSGGTPIYETLLRMQETHLRHLGVTDETGRLLGTLSDRDLMPFQQYGALVLTGEISRAALVEDVVRSCKRTPATVKALVDSGAPPRNVARLISEVCDAATERFVNLAIEELGPPPTRFAFLALGSQGRLEQTLVTDQDNAILYAPPEPGAQGPDPAHYFLELGQRVCGWLNEAGYPFCRGRFMAQNPVWTRELQAWKTHFSYWIARAEPKELLAFTVFFDFRPVCGDAALVDDLRQHVFSELREASAFFPHFASDALLFKPPLMLFGHILIGHVRDAPRGTIDLKATSLPIVAFARLYALRHGIAQTSTLDRLDALAERGKLAPASRDEITATYTFLMRLRLRQQVLDFHAGRTPGNLISVRRLGYSDRVQLRQSFAHIRALQRSIDYDFLGGTHNNPS
jgi:PAS domain S-box-containing protein